MPAIRATANTSPFLCRPSVINDRVSGFIITNASARASRVVIFLSETSTILAAPWASRWVSSSIPSLPLPLQTSVLVLSLASLSQPRLNNSFNPATRHELQQCPERLASVPGQDRTLQARPAQTPAPWHLAPSPQSFPSPDRPGPDGSGFP